MTSIKFDVAAVMLQGGSDLPFECFLDHLDLWMFVSFGGGRRFGLGPHPLNDLPDGIVAVAAASARLGVIRHLLNRREVVFPDGPLDLPIGHPETLADDLRPRLLWPAPPDNSRSPFEGLLPHDAAVHSFS